MAALTSTSAKPGRKQVKYKRIHKKDLTFEQGDNFFERGQFGDVKRAKWCNQEVAVKFFAMADRKGGFYEELQNLSILQKHDSIVTMHGACVSDQPFIVLEFAPLSLEKVIHECKKEYHYNCDHVISWAHQSSVGLNYIHEKGILHRDIKPSNVLLFNKGKLLKLCDFGTAKKLEHTLTNAVGTIRYMAPEVIRGRYYTDRCDVFSFGMMVWEMLARRRPMLLGTSRTNNMAILYAMANGERPPKLSNTPRVVAEMIDQCWDEEPHRRPTMSEIMNKLKFLCQFVELGKPLITRRKRKPENAANPTASSAREPVLLDVMSMSSGGQSSSAALSLPGGQSSEGQSLMGGEGEESLTGGQDSVDQSLSVEGQISPAHQPSSLSPVHHTPTGGELSPSHRQLSPSHQPSMGGRRLSPSTTQGDYPEEQLGAQSTESARPHPSSAAGGRPSQGGQSPSRGQPPQGSQSPLGAQPSQGGQSPSGGHPLPGSQSASRSHTYQNVERPSIPYKAPIPTVDSFTQDMARLNLGGPTPQESPHVRERSLTGPVLQMHNKSPDPVRKQVSSPTTSSSYHTPRRGGGGAAGTQYYYSNNTLQSSSASVATPPYLHHSSSVPQRPMMKQFSFQTRFPRATEGSSYHISELDSDLQAIIPDDGTPESMELYRQYKLVAEEVRTTISQQNKLLEEASNLDKEIRDDEQRLKNKEGVLRNYQDNSNKKDKLMKELENLQRTYDMLRKENPN